MDRALTALAAAAAIAAAAAVGVVSAAFALYALIAPWLGPAGAAAVVAAVAALLVGVCGTLAKRKAQGRKPVTGAPEADPGIVQKIIEVAKERPMLAAGAAVAAGVYAIRHPALVAAVIGAVMQNRSRKP